MKNSLSIVVSAFDEEHNIAAAISSVTAAVKQLISDYEIIVVNDGSADQTAHVIENIQKKNNHIRLINNQVNLGLGLSFREAIKKAKKNYITAFPGDNDMSGKSLRMLLERMQDADLVTAYMVNPHNRSWLRRSISKIYVMVLNVTFGLHLRYFNGPFVCQTAPLKKMPLRATGLTVFAEMKIRMLKKGCTYLEIPFEHTGRKYERSKAVSFKSINTTVRSYILLINDLLIKKNN